MHHPPTPPGLLHVPRAPRCPHSRQGTGGHVLRCSLTRKALPSLSSHLPSHQQGAAADTARGSDTPCSRPAPRVSTHHEGTVIPSYLQQEGGAQTDGRVPGSAGSCSQRSRCPCSPFPLCSLTTRPRSAHPTTAVPHSCVHPLHSTQHSPVELPPSRCPPLRSHRVPPEPSPLTWRQRSPAGALSRTHLPSSAISPSRSAAWRQPRQSQLALTAPTSYRGELALGSGGNEPARGSPGRARRCEETELGGGGTRSRGTPSPDVPEKRAPLRPWRRSGPALSASSVTRRAGRSRGTAEVQAGQLAPGSSRTGTAWGPCWHCTTVRCAVLGLREAFLL